MEIDVLTMVEIVAEHLAQEMTLGCVRLIEAGHDTDRTNLN